MAAGLTPRDATPTEALVAITAIGATHLHRTLSPTATLSMVRSAVVMPRARVRAFRGNLAGTAQLIGDMCVELKNSNGKAL